MGNKSGDPRELALDSLLEDLAYRPRDDGLSPSARQTAAARPKSEAIHAPGVGAGNRGWSIYGAERSQPVAITGKWDGRKNGSDKREPLPSIATGCLSRHMVRRGSTVRVRQRALQRPRKTTLLLYLPLARSTLCGRYGALYGAFGSEAGAVDRENGAFTAGRPAAGARFRTRACRV
jgi:hypothetical protein